MTEATPPMPPDPEPDPGPGPSARRGLRVFVVENHEDTLFLLTYLLEHGGHQVTGVTTMQEALARLPGSNSDVLLSDIGLPDGDGWQLMRRYRAEHGPIYAIAMSGFAMSSDVASSREAGFRHHLVKPVEPETLERLLDEAARELGRS